MAVYKIAVDQNIDNIDDARIYQSEQVDEIDSIYIAQRFSVGLIYNGMKILKVYQHLESDCYWIYAYDDHGNLWEIDVSEEVMEDYHGI